MNIDNTDVSFFTSECALFEYAIKDNGNFLEKCLILAWWVTIVRSLPFISLPYSPKTVRSNTNMMYYRVLYKVFCLLYNSFYTIIILFVLL